MSQSSKHKNESVVETFKDIIPLTFGEELVMQHLMVLQHY